MAAPTDVPAGAGPAARPRRLWFWAIVLLGCAATLIAVKRDVAQRLLARTGVFGPVPQAIAEMEWQGALVKTLPGPDGRALYYVTLNSLYVGGDEGLRPLTQAPDLDGVYVERGTITDAGAEILGGLTQLDELYLVAPAVTDAGVAHLAPLTRVRVLHLTGTRMTDKGLATIGRLASLEKLILTGTDVTDDGLAELKGLTRLKGLWLNRTKITDKGLAHLAPLANLKELWVEGTSVTDAGAAELRKELPNVEILRPSDEEQGLAQQGPLGTFGPAP